MAFRTSPFGFHDGRLTDFAVGPRHEVTLHIALDTAWNQKQERTVLVRFDTIENFDEVTAFFENIKRPAVRDRAIAEVVDLSTPATERMASSWISTRLEVLRFGPATSQSSEMSTRPIKALEATLVPAAALRQVTFRSSAQRGVPQR